MSTKFTEEKKYAFLQGGGEMGSLILEHDWSQSTIGSIDQWPNSLRTTLGNILHSSFPMFLFWGKDLLCFYNDAYRPSLGIDGKHPAFGKKAKEVWPEIWHIIEPMITQALQGKASWNEDEKISMYRNGQYEEVYWTYSYSPAFGDEGKISGVLVTCMETTDIVIARRKIEDVVEQRTEELKNTHQALIASNNYFQRVINLFKEPLQVLSPIFENNKIVDFKYNLTNAAYAAYANTTPEQMKGKKVSEYFPAYFETSSFTKNVEVFESGKPDTWEIHYNVDGFDLFNEMSATRIGDEVIVHFTDFTKMKHLQLELMKKIEELERSNQQLEEFAHAASHDLKEPMRKIHVFTSRLKDQLSDHLKASEIQTFEKIESATRRMSLLVDDLLTYSHVSQQPLEKEAVDLNEILKLILDDLELDIQESHAIINIDKLPVVKGHRRQLQQLFQNLISNAIKYRRADVPVHIDINAFKETKDEKQFDVIKVQDNGIGFEQEYADKIFHLFTRLHGRSEYAGTGVGLSIAKKVAENHEGSIRAHSILGAGSTFEVLLPAE